MAAYENRGIADVHMTASHYFKWTKHNGIPIAMIAVSIWRNAITVLYFISLSVVLFSSCSVLVPSILVIVGAIFDTRVLRLLFTFIA